MSLAVLLDTLRDPGVTSFTIPWFGQFLRQEIPSSLRMLSLRGEITLETVFEEEYVNIPTVAINNDQTSITDII